MPIYLTACRFSFPAASLFPSLLLSHHTSTLLLSLTPPLSTLCSPSPTPKMTLPLSATASRQSPLSTATRAVKATTVLYHELSRRLPCLSASNMDAQDKSEHICARSCPGHSS